VVVVVGGGIAGLAAAWQLTGSGRDDPSAPRVVVLEASTRIGGKILTGRAGGRSVDLGADAFVARRPEAVGLCRELGLDDHLVAPGTSGASVWARGRLRPLPTAMAVGIPTRIAPLARSGIVGPASIARAAFDLYGFRPPAAKHPPGADEALGPLVARHLGDTVVRRLVDPLMGGIHAGGVDDMSTAAVLPPALGARGRRTGLMTALRSAAAPSPPGASGESAPLFLTLRGGMGRMVDALVDALAGRGVALCTGVAVDAVEAGPARWKVHTTSTTTTTDAGGPSGGSGGDDRAGSTDLADPSGHKGLEADALVLAVPAATAAGLLGGAVPDAAPLLGSVTSASVTLATMTFPDSAIRPSPGTGFLVPTEQGLLLTACTWLSAKWPDLARPGDVLVRASCGRYGDDRAMAMSDDDVAARLIDELRAVAGVRGSPDEAVVTRWPDAFPQYRVGHGRRVEEVRRLVAAAPIPVALAGAHLDGVGVPACIGTGRRAARDVTGRLVGATPAPRP
jgi:protoporphyrinogen/coproporphyrinogen III oxidase